MIRSSDRILTTHIGSLYRSDKLMQLYSDDFAGKLRDPAMFQAQIQEEITMAVRRQEEIAIDIPSDGEASRFSFRGYFNDRVSGVERRPATSPFRITSRDRTEFFEFYAQATPHYWSVPNATPMEYVCVGPIRYKPDRVLRDIEMMKEAMRGHHFVQAFFPAQVPSSTHFRIANEYYATVEEMDIAFAEAMREEYRILAEAGFVVQLDDPFLAQEWEMFEPAISLAQYRNSVTSRVELLNYCLQGIPEEMLRLHVCWGSWHAPHAHDLPLADIVDLMLQVKAQAYSIEAANPQHEHEWALWQDTKLPDGKILIPGVVTHKSYVVEHPDLVAQRICRFADLVGKENVIAAPDCGMGGRIQQQVGWAKLKALVEGSRRASSLLWTGSNRSSCAAMQ